MRQGMKIEDEAHMMMRSLSVNYDSGANEPEHHHEWGQLLYAEAGSIRAEVKNTYWLIPPRRTLWIPAYLKHRHRMLGAVKLRTIYVSPEMRSFHSDLRITNATPLLHEAILRACERHWLDRREPRDMRLAELIADELHRSEPVVIQLPRPSDPRAIRIAELFMTQEDPSAPLASYFEQAGVSRRTAERLFNAETGLSPARWRRVFILSKAIELLAQNVAIDEVAERSGYNSRSAFSEAFKHFMGMSPGALRGFDAR